MAKHSATIYDSPSWSAGDFALVTSDNVRFRIPSLTLRAVRVFSDAAGAANSWQEWHLTDPDFERAYIIDRFLALVVHGELPPNKSKKGAGSDGLAHDIADLMRFIDKYGCPALVRHLHLCLFGQVAFARLPPWSVLVFSDARWGLRRW